MTVLNLLGEVNYGAAVAAAVLGLVIGFVWYLPPVLGTQWAGLVSRYTGTPEGELMRPDPRPLVGWAVDMLLNALALALLARGVGAQGVGDALGLAVVGWLAFGATFSNWPVLFARQPVGLWAVNNGAFLLMQVGMALIVTLWR